MLKIREKGLAVPVDVATAVLGKGMLGPYLLPFEMISVVLFAAMAGAVLVAWRKRGKTMSALILFQLVALFLLAVGVFGLIWRRTLVGMLISLELMMNGAGLSIVAARHSSPRETPLSVS